MTETPKARGKVDLTHLKRLIALMRRHDLVEVEVEPNGRVRLRRRESPIAAAPVPVVAVPVPAAADAAAAPAAAAAAPAPAVPKAPADEREGLVEFKSPIVGTFYRASAPDKEAFVDKGSRIRPESPLCIIEAMKVMNEIRAEISGVVVEVLAKNGEPVEFGQPLFLIRPE